MKNPINIENNNEPGNGNGIALWQLGFRPCFMLANMYAVIAMLTWLLIQQGVSIAGLNHYGINFWHAHEMIFAYGMLVIAGFLLTAIKNWTGVQTAQGSRLQLLVFTWLIARLLFFIPGIPSLVLILFDLIFCVLLTLFVAQPLVMVGNKRNYMMIAFVGLLGILNAGFHYAVSQNQGLWASRFLLMALVLILLLISVMAGRVFPMFSQNGVAQRYQAKVFPVVEKSIPAAMMLLAVIWVFFPQQKWLLFVLAAVNTLIHGIRLWGWYNSQIWQKPLVWVLHVGYTFMVLGFAFVAVTAFFPWLHFIALHVLTVGCFGLITIGMMARVSYGHTGRNLHQPPKVLGYVFGLLVMSTLVRVLLPLMDLISYQQVILLSGLFWISAFTLFVTRYLPIWIKPRIDGNPG
jgi:uncharacterized protein involved in response to NO